MNPRVRKAAVLLLLVVGVQLWLFARDGMWGSDSTVLCGLIAFVVGIIPGIRGRLRRGVLRVRHPSPRARSIIALSIAVAAGVYLYFTATWQHQPLEPRTHDEFVYLLQARMLSVGRLWMPPLPHGDFFDTFYVFVEPVYAPLSWPGASLMYVPGIWLLLPYHVMPLVIAGAAVGLMYSVTTQLFDGLCGLIAVLALLALPTMRTQATHTFAQVPILLLGLLLVWTWLRWRTTPTRLNALLIGAVAGWAAITRPIDAICLALPIGIAMLIDWLRFGTRKKLQTIGFVVAGALPFIALQLVFNFGVTGSLTKSPYMFYNDREQPLLGYGFHTYDPSLKSQTKVLQKRLLYEKSVVPALQKHSPSQIPQRLMSDSQTVLDNTLPSPLLIALIPAGVLQWFTRRRFVVWAVLPVFLLLYTAYSMFLSHYALLVAPAMIFLILAGVRAIERNLRFFAPGCSLAVAAVCVSVLPEFSPRRPDVTATMPTMEWSMKQLPKLVQTPALVLFKFHEGLNYNEEPVYNIDTAWPDDAPIIRAHDLGPERNVELLRYYAQHQPDRRVYMVDRRDLSALRELGRAGDLWKPSAATTPSN